MKNIISFLIFSAIMIGVAFVTNTLSSCVADFAQQYAANSAVSASDTKQLPPTATSVTADGYTPATYSVTVHREQVLAPGVAQYTNYAFTANDRQQIVYYVTIADINREDVMMQVSYKGMQHDTIGTETLLQTVRIANKKYTDPNSEAFISKHYAVVSAINGNYFNLKTGKPYGVWAMGGDIITEYKGGSAYIAIGKDGKAYAGRTIEDWNTLKSAVGVQEAINCLGSLLVWDGNITITQTSDFYSNREPRAMLGITEDGKIVCAVVDGRREPFSCGASMSECADIMMEAGCKYAINLDGGNSATYIIKKADTNKCVVENAPSGGEEREIANGILIASTAATQN